MSAVPNLGASLSGLLLQVVTSYKSCSSYSVITNISNAVHASSPGQKTTEVPVHKPPLISCQRNFYGTVAFLLIVRQ
ncbi:hypothetical protein BDR05DRAFT_959897 [Suillus weaverae]|nr:hypothetical protein BDR05DRAFT_959897 [Suillus weaverae]